MPRPGSMALAQGNGRAVASGRPFDRQPDARGKKGSRRRRRPRHRAEGTPQPCLRVTGAISSAVHPPCRSDCVVRTLKLGPVRPVRPAITARFRHRFSFTPGRSFQPRAVGRHTSRPSTVTSHNTPTHIRRKRSTRVTTPNDRKRSSRTISPGLAQGSNPPSPARGNTVSGP